MKDPQSVKRVVYVVSLFPCWSETFIVREINGLIENGVDVRIVSLKKPSEAMVQEDAAALLGRVHHPRSAGHAAAGVIGAFFTRPGAVAAAHAAIIKDGWRSPTTLLKSLVALWRGLEHLQWLREFDAQIIHSHWATYPSTAAWAIAAVLQKPFGFTCHAHDIFMEKQLLARKIEDAALAVTISRFNVEWLQQNATPRAAAKLKVVHCGVDMQRTPWQPDGRAPHTLLAVGRLDPIKGFSTLIEAMALLKDRGVEFDCKLIGSGPLEAELKQQAERLGVAGRIDFSGAQPQPVVRQWMAQASLFVLPSEVTEDGNRDGIPVALMEAMGNGCPVISTRVSGIPELVGHEQQGLLVDERDPTGLADAIQRLLLDRELRQRLTKAARERVEEQFDARKEATRLLGFMQEAAYGR